jgi:PPOX class probable F420-dependent enzyme
METLSAKARAFLNEKRFAVLATINRDGTVQQTTMWYLLDGDTIVMNTKAGRLKERNLRRDQRISFCVEDEYSYITINGKAELIEDAERSQHDIHRLAMRYQDEASAKKMVEQFSKEERVTLLLKPEHVLENL